MKYKRKAIENKMRSGGKEEFGGEGLKVGELRGVVCFELQAYPEPKVLTNGNLSVLMKEFRSTVKVAKHIGASQAYVWSQINS